MSYMRICYLTFYDPIKCEKYLLLDRNEISLAWTDAHGCETNWDGEYDITLKCCKEYSEMIGVRI